MALKDKTLVCRDCGQEFTFTVGEQQFYSSRGLHEPAHCPKCRAARRRERRSSSRHVYSAICATCGVETTVPFQPKEGRPVYCTECYAKIRGSPLFRKARLSGGQNKSGRFSGAARRFQREEVDRFMAKGSGCDIEFAEYIRSKYPGVDEDLITMIEDILEHPPLK